MDTTQLQQLTRRIIGGENITRAEADELALFDNLDTLCEQADIICRHFCGNHVDSCSIVNARSGLCLCLIRISEPTRLEPISAGGFCLIT
ncbi:MAG: hypothetical protein K2I91_03985, partial [Muribaculaceae bacterium]|nr:hypothetical protein [Muribaculaceae bacterium]